METRGGTIYHDDMTTPPRPRSFREFWPHYLSEHRSAESRLLHVIGTAVAVAFILLLTLTGNLWFLLAAAVAGYGFAWVGHFLIERNRPATFRYPVWSLMGDFRMFALACTGQLDRELARHGIGAPQDRRG